MRLTRVAATILLLGLVGGVYLALQGSPAAGIELWHGGSQRVGQFGEAQPDFNLMGIATGRSLSCTVNGGEPMDLEMGSGAFGFRRLGAEGHFNADIPIESLRPGENQVVVTAEGGGASASASVTVERVVGGRCPLPFSVSWKELTSPGEAGQVVDGRWSVEGGGLRSSQMLYDRLFLIGNKQWRDYELLTSITVHAVGEKTGPKSGAPGLGAIMRFAGHSVNPPRFPEAQPKWGYQPFGSILWLRWTAGASSAPVRQFYRGDRNFSEDLAPLEGFQLGSTYALRARCDTDPADAAQTRYRLRVWAQGETEPDTWDLDVTQTSDTALRTGGIALVGHHVDVTFGDLVVTEPQTD